jgi:signal transduction histidine kinase
MRLTAIAGVAVAAIAWPIYGFGAFLSSEAILVSLGAVTTVLADLIANHRAGIRGLGRQLGVLAMLAAVQVAVAVALFAGLMFVSPYDAFLMALAAGYAGLVGLSAARLFARSALSDLDAIRAALAEVAQGAREIHIPVTGDDELATLAAEVEAMVAKVAAGERTRRELVASVSRDLRTPITTLRLIADGLEDGIFERERVREHVRLISTHVRALGSLIDDLFELSRLEAGEVQWSMEQVRLDQLVQETVGAMRPHADASRVAVHAELDQRLAPALGNPKRLQRVLFNLIQNAIRHAPADGSVVVRAEAAPGRAIAVEVADSGNGIDPELRDRVFEPFTQGPSPVA